MKYGSVRAGDRVYLRCRPAHTGTVSKVAQDGFSVTYDFPSRKQHEPRSRFSYPWALGDRFIIGVPPVSDEGLL